VIPLEDPLGPAVIALLLDECPLPTRVSLFLFFSVGTHQPQIIKVLTYVLSLVACHFSEPITCTPDSMTGIFDMPLVGNMGAVDNSVKQQSQTKSQLTATAGAQSNDLWRANALL
jgi:hypothetical protein